MAEESKYDPKKQAYWEYILGDAPIGLGGEEYDIVRKGLRKELEDKLINEHKCPECGSNLVGRTTLTCIGCGLTATPPGE